MKSMQVKVLVYLVGSAMALFLLSMQAWAQDKDGLVHHSVARTLNRLEVLLQEKGITIVTRWNHAERAAAAGIPVRPTELLIFGNPKMGSHLFTSQQTAGIDLPMKALAWEDEKGQVWLGYNDPAHIAGRHGIVDRDGVIKKMRATLEELATAAAAP